MDNKKNTILLTVIAVATLLVAVVGATFAYFTAQGGDAKNADIKVVTGTAGNSSFAVDGILKLEASQTNFGTSKGSVSTDEVTGTVNFTAPGAAGGQTPEAKDLQFCYSVSVTLDANSDTSKNFVYSLGNDKPELLLKITKNGSEIKTLDDSTVIHKTNVTDRLTQSYSGFDITTVTGKTLTIPGPHMLTAEAGQAATADVWKVSITLVNYEGDQNANVGKALNGTLKFEKAICA